MTTLNGLIEEVIAGAYPGSSFAPEIKADAVALLEAYARKVALKALRKAVVAYRPRTANGTAERGAPAVMAVAKPVAQIGTPAIARP